MLSQPQGTAQPKPKFITMKDANGTVVEIPIEQENIVTIFKGIGYREVQMAEPDHADEE